MLWQFPHSLCVREEPRIGKHQFWVYLMAANLIAPDDRFGSGAEVQRLAHLRLLLGVKQTLSAGKRTFAGRLVNHFTAAWFCPLQAFNGAEGRLGACCAESHSGGEQPTLGCGW